jgi:hypothetical protein
VLDTVYRILESILNAVERMEDIIKQVVSALSLAKNVL